VPTTARGDLNKNAIKGWGNDEKLSENFGEWEKLFG
jgi:hypothetical protein